jgi:uncharacterized protein with PIN domain
MSTERQQRKVEIMTQVEKLVEEALEQGDKPLTITDIEEIALAARDQVAQMLTGHLVEQQAEHSAEAAPRCPECGQVMHTKGKKTRYVRTRSGETQMERAYYYCATCRRGSFPPR